MAPCRVISSVRESGRGGGGGGLEGRGEGGREGGRLSQVGLWEEASPYVTETALIRTCWKPHADSDHNLQTQECDLLPAAGVESAACTLAQVVSRSAAAGRRVSGRSTSPELLAGNSRQQQKSIEVRLNLTLLHHSIQPHLVIHFN